MIILLYGVLSQKYGRKHEIQVQSPAEALKALKANFPGFEKDLFNESNGFNVFVGYEEVLGCNSTNPVSNREVCRIVPTVSGAGIGEAFAWYIASQFAISTTTLAIITFAVNAIVTMAINGLAQALFAPPKPSTGGSERPENKPSYIFNGPVNTTTQGNPVGVGYGRMRIGSQVISAGLYTEQIPV